MFGMSLEQGLNMLKGTFEKENLKSIVLFLDEKENKIKVEKFEHNLLELFKEIVSEVPEALAYFQKKLS